MTTIHHQNDNGSRRRLLAILGAIIVGYLVVFVDAITATEFPYSAVELAVIVVIGVVYTFLLIEEDVFLRVEGKRLWIVAYFLVMLGLLILTFLFVDTLNGIWLITMPLVGTAVAVLPQLWGWLVSLAVLATMVVPAAIRFGVDDAFSIGTSLAPAYIFVIIFVRLWADAEEAREDAQKLANQLEGANHQLAAYVAQAEELATTKERNRLAREIHDSLGHYLTVINVQIEAARSIMDKQPEQASDALKKAQTLTQEGLASVRQSVATLRESPLGNRPLSTAIDDLVEEARNAGLVAEFEIMGSVRPLQPNAALTLYRTVQEGLTNVRKHARASRVDLTLDYGVAGEVCLIIKDNGVGAPETNNGGFGLLGVRERLKLLGGKMVLNTTSGNGFELKVVLPE